jgi:hypothetical protein
MKDRKKNQKIKLCSKTGSKAPAITELPRFI